MGSRVITRVNGSKVGTGAPTAASLSTPATSLTAGNLSLFAIRTSHPTTVNSVGDTAGNAYQIAAASIVADPHLYIYYAENCKGNAANQITVAIDTARSYWWVYALQYAGIQVSGSLDLAATSRDVPAVPVIATPVSTASPSELVLLAASLNTLNVFTVGPSFTLIDGLIGDGSTGEFFGGLEEYIVGDRLAGFSARIGSSVSGGPFNDTVAVASFRGAAASVAGPQHAGGRFHL